MTKADNHTWATAALRETLRRCVKRCIKNAERAGRVFAASSATREEAAEQREVALQLRTAAREKGLL